MILYNKNNNSDYICNISNNNCNNSKINITSLLSNDFNNECIEPFFDTQQRLKFNVKCNNSVIPYKMTKKVRNNIKRVNNLTKKILLYHL